MQPFNFDNFFADYPDRLAWSSNEHKYFMTEMSNYIVALLFLPMETRKRDSDLTIMLVHHITSITLIYSGYQMRHYNYGLLVANIHNMTDIFLEGSKLINYLFGEPWSVISFAAFVIAFFVSRMIIYPLYLIIPIVSGIGDNSIAKHVEGWFETGLYK